MLGQYRQVIKDYKIRQGQDRDKTGTRQEQDRNKEGTKQGHDRDDGTI